jgi:hypothetical protein
MKKRIFTFIFSISLVLSFAACGGEEMPNEQQTVQLNENKNNRDNNNQDGNNQNESETSTLLGKWYYVDGGGADGFVSSDMELFSDETVVFSGWGSATSWKITDGYFILSDDRNGSMSYDYDISEGVLTIIRRDGSSMKSVFTNDPSIVYTPDVENYKLEPDEPPTEPDEHWG